MKKLLSLFLVLMFVLLSLASTALATEKGEPNVTVDAVFYDDWSIEITWLPEDGFDSTDTAKANWLTGIATEFVKKHPEVKISCVAQSQNIADAMSKLLTQAATGNAPDLASVDSFYLPLYYDYLQPVTDVFNEMGLDLNSWFPFCADAMTNEDGDVVAMWYDTDVRALYYQKNVMPTPPATWDELFTQMEALKDDGYMFLYPAGANETTSCDIWPWFWSMGGEICDAEGTPVFAQGENYDSLLETFNFLKKTIDTGITPTRVTSFMTDTDVNTDVMTGKVACFVGGSWVGTQLVSLMGAEKFEEEWGIAPIPVKEGASASTCSGGWTCGVFAKDDTKRKLAAELAIMCFVNDTGMLGYTEVEGNLPARADLYEDERFANDWQAKKFCELLDDGHTRPGFEIYTYISQEFQSAIGNVISGAQTPEEAIATMKSNVELY